jgi:hypothetical protein
VEWLHQFVFVEHRPARDDFKHDYLYACRSSRLQSPLAYLVARATLWLGHPLVNLQTLKGLLFHNVYPRRGDGRISDLSPIQHLFIWVTNTIHEWAFKHSSPKGLKDLHTEFKAWCKVHCVYCPPYVFSMNMVGRKEDSKLCYPALSSEVKASHVKTVLRFYANYGAHALHTF